MIVFTLFLHWKYTTKYLFNLKFEFKIKRSVNIKIFNFLKKSHSKGFNRIYKKIIIKLFNLENYLVLYKLKKL